MPRDPKQQAEPAVLPVPRNQCGFVDNKGEVTAAAHFIGWSGEKLREPGELFDHIELKGTIPDAKGFPVIRRLRECVEGAKFIAVIFAAPIPD
jgi:hypothetical protein